VRQRSLRSPVSKSKPGLKICVCTTNTADTEPRAPRHAVALATSIQDCEVVFVDCVPYGQKQATPKIFEGVSNLSQKTCFFPYKRGRVLKFVFSKAVAKFTRGLFRLSGYLHPSSITVRGFALDNVLQSVDADIFVGYNIDALLPIHRAARKKQALTIFDCHEFYSDMGDWQTPLDRKLIEALERKCLPDCDLVLAASERMAEEFASVYGIRRPLTLYNVPPKEQELAEKQDGFSLYWRNLTIDVGQRGLGEAIAALKLLPKEIVLHVQGKLPADGGARLRHAIEQSGVNERVVIHPPYESQEAVFIASRYTIGLCLEQAVNRNHEVTVSNKMFDYLMAGLPVIASDLPGLRHVVERSKAGVLYRPGDAEDLAEKIMALYRDRERLDQLGGNARKFALSEGNLEHEMTKFVHGLEGLLESTAVNAKPLSQTVEGEPIHSPT
jgi:glycosyltransferase involved in cell wall biosynthesis